MYVATVEEMIVQKDRTGRELKAVIVHSADQEEGGEERLPYLIARLWVCPRGQEFEIQGQLFRSRRRRSWKPRRCQLGGRTRRRGDN